MATPTSYSYTVATAFPNAAVDLDSLTTQIQASAIVIALDHITVASGACAVWFKDALSGGDEAVLDGIVAAHTGVPVVVPDTVTVSNVIDVNLGKTDDNRLRVSMGKSDASTSTWYSYDWCNPTTWYSNAVRVVGEVATDSGDHLTYTLAHKWVIDMAHGLRTQEDDERDENGLTYLVTVKVNGVTMTERDPHIHHMCQLARPGYEAKYGLAPGATDHGDFCMDYRAGTLTFHIALDPGDVVTVTYHYATSSQFIMAATPGKTLKVDKVDVQFSGDVVMTDTAIFYTYGYVDYFAPGAIGYMLNPDTGNVYQSGDKFPLKKTTYKGMRDFHNDAFLSYPTYDPLGGPSWRGSTVSTCLLNWDYVGELPINGDAGMEVRVYLEHDEPFDGEFATATFYCAVSNT